MIRSSRADLFAESTGSFPGEIGAEMRVGARQMATHIVNRARRRLLLRRGRLEGEPYARFSQGLDCCALVLRLAWIRMVDLLQISNVSAHCILLLVSIQQMAVAVQRSVCDRNFCADRGAHFRNRPLVGIRGLQRPKSLMSSEWRFELRSRYPGPPSSPSAPI
jgi:hypothetical protein